MVVKFFRSFITSSGLINNWFYTDIINECVRLMRPAQAMVAQSLRFHGID